MNFTVEYANRPEQREGTHLVLMLHGYGANERDLLQVGQMIGGPITYAGLRAPQPVGTPLTDIEDTAVVPGSAFGYQWYPLTPDIRSDVRAVGLATDYVIEFLEQEETKYESVSLLGFSQGMAVATSVARRRPELVKAIVGFSGFTIGGAGDLFDDEAFAAAKLPVFYGRGDADQVVPAQLAERSEQWLREHSEVEVHVYPGMQHAICPEEINDAAAFVKRHILDS